MPPGPGPRIADLATELLATREHVRSGLVRLAARHLALGSDGEITMAHPFTGVPLGFSVMGRDSLWWGGCAWDEFALPHLLPDQVRCWWRGRARRATGPMPGGPTTESRRLAARSLTSWFPPPGCGMTSSTPAGTSGSSAPRPAWPSGTMSQDTSAAPCWTCRRCGGSLPPARLVPRAWLCPPRAERRCRLLAQCRALRHVLAPHLGVIDGGLPWVCR
jgi:hypothetical protein